MIVNPMNAMLWLIPLLTLIPLLPSAAAGVRPLTNVSAIEERLGVVELFRHRPHLAQQLQQTLADTKDPERLLPKAAAALKALLPAEEQQQQQKQQLVAGGWQGAGGVEAEDPADAAAWALDAQAATWKAMQQLPDCLARWAYLNEYRQLQATFSTVSCTGAMTETTASRFKGYKLPEGI